MVVLWSQHCLCLHAAVLHGHFNTPAANISGSAAGTMGTGQTVTMVPPRRDMCLPLHTSQWKGKGAYLLCCMQCMACSPCTGWGTVRSPGSSGRSPLRFSQCATPSQGQKELISATHLEGVVAI